MKKVYLYQRFERFWHWTQTLLIFTLMFTGFEIHGSTSFIGYEDAVRWHNGAAWAFLVLIVFAIFWHLTTDQWRQYLPTLENMKAQLNYYWLGIFENAPHPTRKRTLSKLNPLQRITYFSLNVLILPIMVISGFLYLYFNYPVPGIELDSLEPIALIHTMGAYVLAAFVIIHLYLITTGHTVTSNLKAMVTGWEEMDDDEVQDIVEEVMEEASHIIKPVKGGKSKKDKEETKEFIVKTISKNKIK